MTRRFASSGRRGRSADPVRRRDDRGAADALGLALIAPAALGLALVILLLGRGVDSRATAQNAAEAAAQAAARERSLPAAHAAADRTAAAMLVDADTCADPAVSVGIGGGFEPGAVVSVTVTCTATTRGLELVGGDSSTSSATAYAVIDRFRGVDR